MKKAKGYMIVLAVLACLFLAASIALATAPSANIKPTLKNEYHLVIDSEGWEGVLSEGAFPVTPGATVDAPDGRFLYRKELFPEEMGKNVLLFNNERQCVTVRADGEVLFRMGAGERRFRFSATSFCAVQLPEKGHGYWLEVEFSGLDEGFCVLPEMAFGTLNDVLIFLCRRDIVTIASIPLLALLGVILTILTAFLLRKRIYEPRLISLAIFLLIAVSWSISDMEFCCLLPIDAEFVSTFSHCMLMLMPVPILFFIYWSCRHRRLRSGRAVHLVLLGNILLQTGLFLTKTASIHVLLPVSQGLLLLTLFYGTAATSLDYLADKNTVSRIQAAAFGISSLLGSTIVLAYWLTGGNTQLYHTIFQATIYVFLVGMLCVLMISIEQRSYLAKLKDAELSAYRTISEIDQLTGLGNRFSFDKTVEEVQSDPKKYPGAALVFMDLNGLKFANDKFGHMAGDELIIAAGKCIRKAFEPIGKTFRIGGDEFAAVVENTGADMLSCYEEMDRAVEEYNASSRVPLSIARGSCPLVDDKGRRLSVSDWKANADKRMYEDKVINHRGNTRGSAEDYLEIISSFVSAVDAKDSYTADHSSRVGLLADRICRDLGISEASSDQIHMAACLHDIGKIGIPDSILTKETKLTPEEWRIMQSHVITGEEIIKQTRAFYEVSQIIRHHHERFDGSGYPDGISGAEIPIGARIIAIADSIDAMTSSRSYRKALPPERCREEIQKNLGVMYDPAIGSIVLEHWDEIEKIILHQMAE